MTYSRKNPQVGDIVYPPYTPAMVGKIISVGPLVIVRKRNGEEYGRDPSNLHDFRELVESHQRKAKKQGDILKQLEAMP